jgi:RNA polymerase sigma factor (sigma-70 family)
MLNDNMLMLKVRDGDLDKLGLLFERYKRPLYGFFYGLNKSSELSEDLVQNVFLRILKYRHLFRGDGEFKTWMFHIARNVNNDHFRKKKIDTRDSLESWQEKLGHNENRSTEIQQQEEHMLLSMAMDRLPFEKKEILLLSKFLEKNYKEIGDLLGCTEGTVKARVFRALQELRLIYKQLEKQL